jgi:hypothetical protein
VAHVLIIGGANVQDASAIAKCYFY